MAGQESPIFLAQSEHIRADAVTGDSLRLSVQHRRLRSRSTRWPDLLVGHVGDSCPADGLGGCTGSDDIALAGTHRCATDDWGLHDCPYVIYFAFRRWDFAIIASDI